MLDRDVDNGVPEARRLLDVAKDYMAIKGCRAGCAFVLRPEQPCNCGREYLQTLLSATGAAEARITALEQERGKLDDENEGLAAELKQAQLSIEGERLFRQRAEARATAAEAQRRRDGEQWTALFHQHAAELLALQAHLTAVRAYMQHKPECRVGRCAECAVVQEYHDVVVSHVFIAAVCTCGLDAVLAPPSQETSC